MSRTALQLRCLIRVAEARISALTVAVRGEDYPAPFGCKARLEQAHAELALYTAELASIPSPVAPGIHHQSAVRHGPLVTSRPEQPASPLQNS